MSRKELSMSVDVHQGAARESTLTAKPTCKFCGSDKGFREYGSVTIRSEASRTLRSAEMDASGKVKKTRWENVDIEHEFADDEDFEPDYVRCRNCDAEDATLEDLTGKPPVFEPGARVIAPNALRAVVAAVDPERRRLTVENWHEEFKFDEVTPLAVAA